MTHPLLKTTEPKFLDLMKNLSTLFLTLATGAGSLALIFFSSLPDTLSDKTISAIYGNAADHSSIVSVAFLITAAAFRVTSILEGERRWKLLPFVLFAAIFITAGFYNGQILLDLSKSLSMELRSRASDTNI